MVPGPSIVAVPAPAGEASSPLPPAWERHFAEASFTVPAAIERVFPMFDPVEESRWAEGWAITPVQPAPFRVEKGAVFLTESGGRTAVWTILRFEPAAHAVEYLVVVPELQQRWITVRCAPAGGGDATEVTVSYRVTALGVEGNAAVRHYDEDFIRGWREPVRRALEEVPHGSH